MQWLSNLSFNDYFFGFAFLYPLFMAWLWIAGGIWFYLKREYKQNEIPQPSEHACSILIPCFNEEEQVRETIKYAMQTQYPDFEVIAINDGSSDKTAQILDELQQVYPRLRVVHLAENQGKAYALRAGAMVSQHEYLVCIDGDALLHPHAVLWMMHHLTRFPRVGAVTGNPRIINRSSILGKIQVGEFSSIVGMIKRAQRVFGRLFTVSGVITAFRKSAVHEVGYWSPNMLTEDIDITWKLQRAGWDVEFEPNALVWILMPETLKGLYKQRLRWAMGGAQVLIKNFDVLFKPGLNFLWPLMLELLLTLVWSYLMLLVACIWLVDLIIPNHVLPVMSSPFLPYGTGILLGATCLFQFMISKWMDSRYEPGLLKNYYWMIWYPFVFWLITVTASILAFPKVLMRGDGKRARWVSPDRGIR